MMKSSTAKARWPRKMPGDEWQQFANLRALLAYQWLFPGKKLLMMGREFGQTSEWNANSSIDWWLLEQGPYHCGAAAIGARPQSPLPKRTRPVAGDCDTAGFFWIDCSDVLQSVLSFVRQTPDGKGRLAVILNLTPEVRAGYRIGLPEGGHWREVLNTDSQVYGGSNQGNLGGVNAEAQPVHNQPFSAAFTLPPLSVIAFRTGP